MENTKKVQNLQDHPPTRLSVHNLFFQFMDIPELEID